MDLSSGSANEAPARGLRILEFPPERRCSGSQNYLPWCIAMRAMQRSSSLYGIMVSMGVTVSARADQEGGQNVEETIEQHPDLVPTPHQQRYC